MKEIRKICFVMLGVFAVGVFSAPAMAATSLPFSINMSENVIVDTTGGTPRVAIDVGGVTRYATYTSGSGSSSLVFTYDAVPGDVDLDGVTLSSPLQLNGGTMRDAAGNDAALTFTLPNTANVRINYPSLGMDFVADADGRYTVNGTVYNTLSSFLTAVGGTFTRGSIGTYFDSSGVLQTASAGVARFDHDPATLAAKGLLIEESRTNMATQSVNFTNASWFPVNSAAVTPNTAIAPDGTLTASTLNQPNTFNDYIYLTPGASGFGIPNTRYTLSIYFKQGTKPNFGFQLDWNSFGGPRICTYYEYASQSIVNGCAGAAAILSSSVIQLPNGWFRLIMTFITDGTTTNGMTPMIGRAGGGTGTTFIWGLQLEQGDFATSYIPTAGSAVTRAADILTMPTTGWYNEPAGSYFADVDNATMSSAWGNILGAGASDRQSLFGNNSSILAGRNPFASASRTPGAPFKAAYAYQSSGLALSVNGGAINTGGAQSSNPPSSINVLGSWDAGFTTGHIKKARYYPVRVGNTQLQLMTQ